MNVVDVQIDEEKATEQYKMYREAVKTRKSKQYNDLRRAYHAMSKGYKVIDIFKAFEDTGVDEKGNPKLAIAQADKTSVGFHKEREGAGFFSSKRERWNTSWQANAASVVLPSGTFPKFDVDPKNTWSILANDLVTNVPIVPADLLPKDSLSNYYILFEVDEWKRSARVADPYLLKRINDNTFIVWAEWDVTEVEKIVMRSSRVSDE